MPQFLLNFAILKLALLLLFEEELDFRLLVEGLGGLFQLTILFSIILLRFTHHHTFLILLHK